MKGRQLALPALVGTAGFEPATSSSRTMRATKLRHVPSVEIVATVRSCEQPGSAD